MKEIETFELVPRLLSALEKPEVGAKRIVAGMVSDVLAIQYGPRMRFMVYPMSYIEQKITEDIEQYSAPLCFFSKRAFEPQDTLHTATVAFVDTGQDKFLITCHHVLDAFDEMRKESSDTVMAAPIGPNNQLIVLDQIAYIDGDRKYLDLAVLRLPEPEVLRSGFKRYYPAERWPNEQARQDELIAIIGYPAQHRQSGRNSIRFPRAIFCDYVTRVTDRQVSIRDDHGDRQQFSHEDGIEQLEGDLGGMSGSPAFSLRKGKFELVGFFTDGYGTVNGQVLVSHAHFILPDGKLKHLLWI